MKNQHVVVTGASSGIGEHMARSFAARGANVTLVARRAEHLQALAKELNGHAIVWDLCNPSTAADFLTEAQATFGSVDILVNNAGVQVIGRTHQVDPEAAERSVALNLLSPLRLIRAVLPDMIARNHGTIVNIASMAALAPTPGMTWYNAGKAGLAAASEALRGELRDTDVQVLTVYPGIIADTDMGRDGLATYTKFSNNPALRFQPIGTAQQLGERVVQAVERRRARLIWPHFNILARHFPQLTRWAMDTLAPIPGAV